MGIQRHCTNMHCNNVMLSLNTHTQRIHQTIKWKKNDTETSCKEINRPRLFRSSFFSEYKNELTSKNETDQIRLVDKIVHSNFFFVLLSSDSVSVIHQIHKRLFVESTDFHQKIYSNDFLCLSTQNDMVSG